VYSIFDAIDVELAVKRGPPMDLDAFVIAPAEAIKRSEQLKNGEASSASSSSAAQPSSVVVAPEQIKPDAAKETATKA
jgi:hypothetical protein